MVVFFDIDGTIVDNDSQIIPQSAVDAVAALKKNGHLPVVNTGRPYSHIDPRVRAMDFSAWVCGCGMETMLNGVWLNRSAPDEELCRFVVEKARQTGVLPLYEAEDGSIVYDPSLFGNPKQLLEIQQMKGKGFSIHTIQEHPQFMKFVTWEGRPNGSALFWQAMEPYFEIIHRGKNSFTEYVLKGHSKANGMQALLDRLGVSRENTLAIGDSTNDLPMFSVAAHTACMGNGMEELKARSEYITASVLEGGIAQALRHFRLI